MSCCRLSLMWRFGSWKPWHRKIFPVSETPTCWIEKTQHRMLNALSRSLSKARTHARTQGGQLYTSRFAFFFLLLLFYSCLEMSEKSGFVVICLSVCVFLDSDTHTSSPTDRRWLSQVCSATKIFIINPKTKNWFDFGLPLVRLKTWTVLSS